MSSPSAGRRRHRPALIVLAVVAATVCLAMAWWQWDRYESASGTAQNLGYALQWPAFAVAVIYAYRRFVVLENNPEEAAKLQPTKGSNEIPAGILPERQTIPSAASLTPDATADSGLVEYNRYLAELAENDRSTGNASPASAPPETP